MLTVLIDRNRISTHFKATVNVNSDEPVYAYEARATITGQPYGRSIGYDLLSDDVSSSDGIVTLSTPVNRFSFDIESTELSSDSDYRISVYARNEGGVWDDCCQLYTCDSETVMDSESKYILVKRIGNGTDTSYASAYSGNDINNFITEVFS